MRFSPAESRGRLKTGLRHGVLSAVAALLAYWPTHVLGLREGFWAAIAAIAIVQTEFQTTRSTARDQFLGAAIGGAIAVAVSIAIHTPNLLAYASVVVVSVLTCWMLKVPSASRLSGITATIILLVPHAGSAERMFVARLTEVGWGVSVAIAVVWVAARNWGRSAA
jgi:uncharacterized membrane protein YgaE (UPF0421/DUF939 family)